MQKIVELDMQGVFYIEMEFEMQVFIILLYMIVKHMYN